MSDYLLTSESVTEGHPDKVCDQISDRLLDCYLKGDKNSHVAVETMVSKNVVFVAGEISSKTKVDVVKEIRKVLLEIGYDSEEITTFSREIVENIPKNFCSDTCVNWKVCGEIREIEVCDNCDEEKKD